MAGPPWIPVAGVALLQPQVTTAAFLDDPVTFPPGAQGADRSPMPPGDLMTPAKVSGADLQAPGCHFLPGVSWAGLRGGAHRVPLSSPHQGPHLGHRPHWRMTWATSGQWGLGRLELFRGGALCQGLPLPIKASPGLVSRFSSSCLW